MESLLPFIEHFDGCSANLKFTFEVTKDKVSFLDTWVKIEGNKLITDLFSKPTDSYNYLVYNSAHPQRCKDSITYIANSSASEGFAVNFWISTHVIHYYHFLRRVYHVLLQETDLMAREQSRTELLSLPHGFSQSSLGDRVFLITHLTSPLGT